MCRCNEEQRSLPDVTTSTLIWWRWWHDQYFLVSGICGYHQNWSEVRRQTRTLTLENTMNLIGAVLLCCVYMGLPMDAQGSSPPEPSEPFLHSGDSQVLSHQVVWTVGGSQSLMKDAVQVTGTQRSSRSGSLVVHFLQVGSFKVVLCLKCERAFHYRSQCLPHGVHVRRCRLLEIRIKWM
jgi:hypothetical protein